MVSRNFLSKTANVFIEEKENCDCLQISCAKTKQLT